MSASEAAATVKLPPGFQVSVFAQEPAVMNPLAMNWDSRGRLWVAENFTFSESLRRGSANSFNPALRDRIVIFEGGDGEGRFRTRRVFRDDLQRVMSVAVGYGGVWVMAVPELLFIPDRNQDGIPDGPAEVMLDGFNMTGLLHTVANGLQFGPDGWLYGRCGHSNHGAIGPPGTPDDQRTPLRGSLWRYHPIRRTFEALSAGTVNPWGHDWDQHGELFFVNTIIGHLWHQIPGAHYMRSTSRDPNPWVYESIDTHADHWHFASEVGWSKSRGTEADSWGGGHAAVGAMIYQGDNWPPEYRGGLYTLNLFGHRMNHEILERRGSGYVGHHGQDMFVMADPWFRGLALNYGPDGGVFVADWSDTGEYTNRDGVHRNSGRIYKITYGDAPPSAGSDLSQQTVDQLIALHTHPNEWFSRQARQELVVRLLNRRDVGGAASLLHTLYTNSNDVPVKLRSLWTLHILGAAGDDFLREQLRAPDEHLRAWAIRLLTDRWPLDTVMSTRPDARIAGPDAPRDSGLLREFTRMAAEDSSGLVRLVLASTLQRLPVTQRTALGLALASRREDADDHNLPLMIWYGLIPLGLSEPTALPLIAAKAELPLTRTFIARRLAEEIEKNPQPLEQLIAIATEKSAAFQRDVIEGMAQALKGLAAATKPATWDRLARKVRASKDAAQGAAVRRLDVIFGDAAALAATRQIALDPAASLEERKAALQSLVDCRPPDTRPLMEKFLPVRSLNAIAARTLATFDDPQIGPLLVASYAQFDISDRPQLVAALTTRAVFARSLLEAVAAGTIPPADISPSVARQIRSLNDPVLNQKLAAIAGDARDLPPNKRQLLAKYKAQLAPAVISQADKSQGRLVFSQVCAACHTLYGEGGKIGPDLTGGNRQSLDYILQKIVDPSAQISPDYRYSTAQLKDGRTLTGIVSERTSQSTTLRTLGGPVTIPSNEIQSVDASTQSLMPEGLFEALRVDQRRDLVGYLMDTTQSPLPDK